jgi:replicative DNA helicase
MNQKTFEKGLPANLDAERYVLGSLLLGDRANSSKILESVRAHIGPDDFSLNRNKIIFEAMLEMEEKKILVDRVTLADHLISKDKLDAIGGISYLVELDEGLPQIFNLDEYVRIVQSKSRLRSIITSLTALTEKAMSGEDEPDEIIREVETKLSGIGAASNSEFGLLLGNYISDYPGGINSLLRFDERMKGIMTGFPSIDDMTGGLLGGSVTCLAGYPGTGKTAMALCLARNMASTDHEVVIFSPEMTVDPLFNRLFAREADILMSEFRDVKPDRMSAEERRKMMLALGTLSDIGIRIDDTSGITPLDIHRKVSALKAKKKVGAVFIDYFQLLKAPSNMRFQNDTSKQEWISNTLTESAKKLQVPFIVLSQLRKNDSRDGKREPELDDLKGSGALGQDAWLVLMLRNMHIPDRSDTKGNITAYCRKNRVGPQNHVKLKTNLGKNMFWEESK